MIHLGSSMLVAGYFFKSKAGSIRNSIRLMTRDQQLAAPCKVGGAVEHECILVRPRRRRVRANLVTRESKCRRITVRPWRGRCSLSGDSIKRILVAGCSE